MTPVHTLERGTSGNAPADTSPAAPPAPAGGPGTPAPAAPPARRELFVVATHKVRDRSGNAPNRWLPYGTEHAWEPGSRRTLCGEWTTGWTVFWDRRFSARPAAACSACVEATLPEESRRRLDHFETSRS
jgi:hypothetical protein